jgi:hypothetical protein
MRKSGEKPSAERIRRCWNAYCETGLPWSCDAAECADAQAMLHLGSAFATFFLPDAGQTAALRYPNLNDHICAH